MSNEKETVFFKEYQVLVTCKRLVLPEQTFAMSGVTSVRTDVEVKSKFVPALIMILGIVIMLRDFVDVGALMSIVGATWFLAVKNKYHVFLQTISGEAKAITSTDGDLITRVVNALNYSIIYRR